MGFRIDLQGGHGKLALRGDHPAASALPGTRQVSKAATEGEETQLGVCSQLAINLDGWQGSDDKGFGLHIANG